MQAAVSASEFVKTVCHYIAAGHNRKLNILSHSKLFSQIDEPAISFNYDIGEPGTSNAIP